MSRSLIVCSSKRQASILSLWAQQKHGRSDSVHYAAFKKPEDAQMLSDEEWRSIDLSRVQDVGIKMAVVSYAKLLPPSDEITDNVVAEMDRALSA